MDSRRALITQVAGGVFAMLVAVVVVVIHHYRRTSWDEYDEFNNSRVERIEEEVVSIDEKKIEVEDGGDKQDETSQSSQKRAVGSTTSTARSRRKKRRKLENAPIERLIHTIQIVAEAIESISIDWEVKVNEVLMSFDGQFPRDMLEQAFLHLSEKGEIHMKAFVFKEDERKKKWLDKFLIKHYVAGMSDSD